MPVLETAAGIAWASGNWEISGGYELAAWYNLGGQHEVFGSDTPNFLMFDGFFVRMAFRR